MPQDLAQEPFTVALAAAAIDKVLPGGSVYTHAEFQEARRGWEYLRSILTIRTTPGELTR